MKAYLITKNSDSTMTFVYSDTVTDVNGAQTQIPVGTRIKTVSNIEADIANLHASIQRQQADLVNLNTELTLITKYAASLSADVPTLVSSLS